MLTRRRFLRAGAAGACVAAGLDAFAFEPAWLDVTTWNVDVPSLPSELPILRLRSGPLARIVA